MPGASIKRHKLDEFARSTNKKVTTHFYTLKLRQFRAGSIQGVGEQFAYLLPTEFSHWQADTVHDDQAYLTIGAFILVRAMQLHRHIY